MNKKRKGTKTSKFGVPGRINHDSSEFYSSRLYEDFPAEKEVEYIENEISKEYLNKVFPLPPFLFAKVIILVFIFLFFI